MFARAALIVLSGLSVLPSSVAAWTADGHVRITTAALQVATPTLPPMSAADRSLLVRASVQPDLMRPRRLPLLRDLEGSRHYIDLELLDGAALPPGLSEFVHLVENLSANEESGIGPDWQFQTIGILPYALTENTERLAVLFAQLRRRPNDKELMVMAMYVAGSLAHYAQDLCQPLHTSIHHDGRVAPGGRSPETGIHMLVDALPSRLAIVESTRRNPESQSFDSLFRLIERELAESHALVDSVYRLESDIRDVDRGQGASLALREFTRQRFERAVALTADLLQFAWELSESIDLSAWEAVKPGD